MPIAMNLTPAHTSTEGARHCPPATSACRALPVGDGPRSYSSCVFSLPGSTPPLPLNQQQEKVAEAPNSRSGSDDNLSEMLCAMRQASADRSFASATKDALSDEQITRDEAIALLRSHGFPEGAKANSEEVQQGQARSSELEDKMQKLEGLKATLREVQQGQAQC